MTMAEREPRCTEPVEITTATSSGLSGLVKEAKDLVDRNQSVAGAFRVTRPRMVAGRSVLLIDDVFTTGSTLSACASTLFNAGAARVNLLTIARVINH